MYKKRKLVCIYLCSLVALSVVLSGCSPFEPLPQRPEKIYTLTSVSTQRFRARSSSISILVTAPSASPGYQTSQMIYVNSPFRIAPFAENRWVAAPSEMLLPLMVASLRNMGYFDAVVEAPFAGRTTFKLNTHLFALQQNFLQSPSYVREVVQATLVNEVTDGIVASQLFSAVVNAPSATPYGGVVAANQANARIMRQLAKFCVNNARI